MEYVYYCKKPGQLEDLICTLDKPITRDQKDKLFPIMERDGFDLSTFREFIFNWQKPDFVGAIAK